MENEEEKLLCIDNDVRFHKSLDARFHESSFRKSNRIRTYMHGMCGNLSIVMQYKRFRWSWTGLPKVRPGSGL